MRLSYLKFKNKIDEFFKKHRLTYHQNSTKQFVFDKCPICKTNKKEKFYFDPNSTTWVCFKCGEKGNIITLISKTEKIENWKVVNYLINEKKRVASKTLNYLDVKELEEEDNFIQRVEDEFKVIPVDYPYDIRIFSYLDYDQQYYGRFYKYLDFRNLSPEMVYHFMVSYSSVKERIIFPVYFKGVLVGWQGRAINNEIQPKALTEPFGVFKKSHYLMNYDNVYNANFITIVEGPIDAAKCYKKNPVALLGKTISDIQLRHIYDMPNLETVFIALDPEEKKAQKTLYEKLSPLYNCLFLDIEIGSDCGDKTPGELENYFLNAQNYNHLKLLKKKLKT